MIEEIICDCDTLIFDFDGTLIDSEPYHKKAHSLTLSKILNKNINLSDKEFERYIGKSDYEIFEMYKKDFNIDFDKDKIINKKVEFAKNLLLDKKVKIFDYFFDLLKNKNGKKFYIVSNQNENLLKGVLKSKKISDAFEKIFCLSSMNVKKDYFYSNISTFLPNKKQIAVFEDDVKIINFLKDLDFKIIGVENKMNQGKLDGRCTYVIKTIKS